MKWNPHGKVFDTTVEAYRKGCGGESCIHIHVNVVCQPNDAKKLIKALQSAIKYCEGRN